MSFQIGCNYLVESLHPTGAVSVVIDLENWWKVESYDLFISVTDGVHYDGPYILTINILDLRAAPFILNLDAVTNVTEDAPGGTKLFKVTSFSYGITLYDIPCYYPYKVVVIFSHQVEVASPSDPSTYEFSLEDYNHHFHIDSKSR